MVFLQQDTSSSSSAKGYDVQSQVEQTIKDVNTRSGKSVAAMPGDDKSGLIKSFSAIQQQMNSLSQQISQVESKKASAAP